MRKSGLQPDHSIRDLKAMAATAKAKSRFWGRVDKTDTCWLWDTPTSFVYGQFYVNGVAMAAHRIAKLWESGLPEKNLFCCHLCRNKNCVRPDHTYWGTPKENVADRKRDSTDNKGVRHGNAKITEEDARQIWEEYRTGNMSQRQISERRNISEGIVAGIIKKCTWLHVTKELIEIPKDRKIKSFPRGETHHKTTLPLSQVLAIKRLLALGARQRDIIAAACLPKHQVQRIAQEKTWAHLSVFERKLILSDDEAALCGEGPEKKATT